MTTVHQRKKALGCEIIIVLRLPSNTDSRKKIFQLVWSEINNFEKRFSRFFLDSELSNLNNKAGQLVEVSSEFKVLVQETIKMAEESNNLFNPFILPPLQKSGYVGSWPRVKTGPSDLDFSNRKICTIQDIQIAQDYIKIPSQCALDFGGIGKGYLLDEIADLIESRKIKDYWLSFGGDLICSGSREGAVGWQIGIASAKNGNVQVDMITTRGERTAIATSGVTKRKGVKEKKSWHHIIDPTTALPAQSDILTATVVSKTAILADIYAKSLIILGSDEAEQFIKNKKIILGLLQTKDGLIKKIENKQNG